MNVVNKHSVFVGETSVESWFSRSLRHHTVRTDNEGENMQDLSDAWAAYARIQQQLDHAKQSGDHHWGLEYALNKTLDDIQEGRSFDSSDVERRIQTGARRNRYRSRLMRIHYPMPLPEATDPCQSHETRSALSILHVALGDNGYRLLRKVAAGYDYNALADGDGVKASTLRKRVSRLRSRARQLGDWNN